MHELTLKPGAGDATPSLRKLLSQRAADLVIVLEPGDYHFWPDEAVERYCYISNNRHGLKRIAFDLTGMANVTVRGNGARLFFHGEILPFYVAHADRVTIQDLSVDWVRPFYSQGTVVAADAAGVDVRIDRERYPYRVENRRIIFEGEGWESPLVEGVFAFDPATRAPAYRSGDSMGLGFPPAITVDALDADLVRLVEPFPARPEPGHVVVFRHYRRWCPAVTLTRSRRVCLDGVTLHHAGAMGVIAQFCEDVFLSRCRVTPAPGRLFSVAADATHFVNCRGMVTLEDCLFENQLDDPVNVHGINSRIKRITGARSVLTERVHHEQHGVEVGLPGDTIAFADNTTLLSYAENVIAAVQPVNARYAEVTFEHDLPGALRPGHVMDNASWRADLRVSGCTVRNNRARGLLISTPGKVVVENNRIEAAGSGIKISGDANYWFESGAVREVSIRHNHFGDCCFGAEPWGRSVISIDPEIEERYLGGACFHRNIRIEGNRFETFDAAILFARSVDGLVFTDNVIARSGTYPPIDPEASPVRLQGCRNVELEGNLWEGRREPVRAEVEIPAEAVSS